MYKVYANVSYKDESKPVATPSYEIRYPFKLQEWVGVLIRSEPEATKFEIIVEKDTP